MSMLSFGEGAQQVESPRSAHRKAGEPAHPNIFAQEAEEDYHPILDEHKVTDGRPGPWVTVALVALPVLLGAAAGFLFAVVPGAPIAIMLGTIAIGAIIGLTASAILLWTLEARYRNISFEANPVPDEEYVGVSQDAINAIVNSRLEETYQQLKNAVTKHQEHQINDLIKEMESIKSQIKKLLTNITTSIGSSSSGPSTTGGEQNGHV